MFFIIAKLSVKAKICLNISIGIFILSLVIDLNAQVEHDASIDSKYQMDSQSDSQLFFDEAEISANVLWLSKYISEGRDNLEDGGINSFETSLGLYGMSIAAWYAYGSKEDYQELNVTLGYDYEIMDFNFCVGYTRLEFLRDKESDNEFSAGCTYNKFYWLIPGIDYVYSTEANGSFLEFFIKSDELFLGERLNVAPYLLKGFDFGYATEEYNGFNNLQIGLDASFSLTEKISFMGSFIYSWALEDVKRENLGDVGSVGFGLFFEL